MRLLLLLALSSLLAACSVRETFYQPQAEGGRLSGANCQGAMVGRGAGPPEVVTIDRGGISVRVRATSAAVNSYGITEHRRPAAARSDGSVHVIITFLVPANTRFRLLSDEVEVTSRAGGEPARYAVAALTRFSGATPEAGLGQISPTVPLTGRTVTWWGPASPEPFWAVLTVPEPQGGAFTIVLPRVEVDGAALALPRIDFSRKTETVRIPSDC